MATDEEKRHEVRCPQCDRLLLRVSGLARDIEIKCPRCGIVVVWPRASPVTIPPDKSGERA